MTEFVKHQVAWVAALVILWFGSAQLLTEEGAGASERKKLESILPRFLAQRPAEQELQILDDPYRFGEPVPYVAEETSTSGDGSDEEEGMDSSSLPLAGVANRPPPRGTGATGSVLRGAAAGGVRPVGTGAQPTTQRSTDPSRLPPPVAPVRLWVDAVLASSAGGRAFVCGVSVEVGEEIPGVDELAPPVLQRIDGIKAHILYRGEVHELSIDEPPRLVASPEGFPDAELQGADWFFSVEDQP